MDTEQNVAVLVAREIQRSRDRRFRETLPWVLLLAGLFVALGVAAWMGVRDQRAKDTERRLREELRELFPSR